MFEGLGVWNRHGGGYLPNEGLDLVETVLNQALLSCRHNARGQVVIQRGGRSMFYSGGPGGFVCGTWGLRLNGPAWLYTENTKKEHFGKKELM